MTDQELTEAEIRERASTMRTRAQYADRYGDYRREMDAANQWEADRLRELRIREMGG